MAMTVPGARRRLPQPAAGADLLAPAAGCAETEAPGPLASSRAARGAAGCAAGGGGPLRAALGGARAPPLSLSPRAAAAHLSTALRTCVTSPSFHSLSFFFVLDRATAAGGEVEGRRRVASAQGAPIRRAVAFRRLRSRCGWCGAGSCVHGAWGVCACAVCVVAGGGWLTDFVPLALRHGGCSARRRGAAAAAAAGGRV